MTEGWVKAGSGKWLAALCIAALGLALVGRESSANHGDIHARCDGDRAVVTQRPPGMEQITVVCVDGMPEFVVNPNPIAVYDPVSEGAPRAIPPDFGGWVTVCRNACESPLIWYNMGTCRSKGCWI